MRLSVRPRDIFATFLLLLMVVTTANSIKEAQWAPGLQILIWVAIFGTLIGFFLSRSSISPVKAHVLAFILGFFIVTWQTGRTLDPIVLDGEARSSVVLAHLREWISVVMDGGRSYDPLVFIFVMAFIVWLLAYNNAWFVLNYGWVWWAIIPTGVVILVNVSYSPARDYATFGIFLFLSLLLMIYSHFSNSSERWAREGVSYDSSLPTRLFLVGTAISILLLMLAWRGPDKLAASALQSAWKNISTPIHKLQDGWERAFAFLYGSRPSNSGIGGGFASFTNNFRLGGPLNLGNRVVFIALGDPLQYWQAAAYDTYTGTSWEQSSAENPETSVKVESPQLVPKDQLGPLRDGLQRVDQEVTLRIPLGHTLLAADRAVSFDKDAIWDLSREKVTGKWSIDSRKEPSNAAEYSDELGRLRDLILSIGPDKILRATADGVVFRRNIISPTPTTEQSQNYQDSEFYRLRAGANELQSYMLGLREDGLETTYRYSRGEGIITFSYYKTNIRDIMSVTAVDPLEPGQTYKATSIVANPTDAQLNKVTQQPPQWVKDKYLQLPPDLPDRVRQLALDITRNAKTTHQKASAIEAYLRKMKYREDMPPTPEGEDFVDYFLFHQREGYCTYFSSAMVVMLRSIGIPARVATGFAPGKYDSRIGRYVVTESLAHAWVQVYYPGYGWVNYEPTPARPEINRSPAIGGGTVAPQAPDRNAVNPDAVNRAAGQGGSSQEIANSRDIFDFMRIPFYVLSSLIILVAACYGVLVFQLRGLSGARRQYAKLIRLAYLIGVIPAKNKTPNEFATQLSSAVPGVSDAVGRITNSYVEEVYGHRNVSASTLKNDWRIILLGTIRNIPSYCYRWLIRIGNTLRRE